MRWEFIYLYISLSILAIGHLAYLYLNLLAQRRHAVPSPDFEVIGRIVKELLNRADRIVNQVGAHTRDHSNLQHEMLHKLNKSPSNEGNTTNEVIRSLRELIQDNRRFSQQVATDQHSMHENADQRLQQLATENSSRRAAEAAGPDFATLPGNGAVACGTSYTNHPPTTAVQSNGNFLPAARTAKTAGLRKPYLVSELFAPYRNNKLPSAEELKPMQCYDLDGRSMTFLVDMFPDYDAVVVRLGHFGNSKDLTARIVGCEPFDTSRGGQFRVECAFTGRVYL